MGLCRDPQKLHPYVLERQAKLCAWIRDDLHTEAVIIETVRYPGTQDAYYARGRFPLEFVNGLYRKAGLPPITDGENRRIITRVKVSRHFPGPDGLSRAVDIGVRDPSLGGLWNPKLDADADGVCDWDEIAAYAESIGLVAGRRFHFVDSGHFEAPEGI